MKLILKPSIAVLFFFFLIDKSYANQGQYIPASSAGNDTLSPVVGQYGFTPVNGDMAIDSTAFYNEMEVRYKASVERLKEQAAIAKAYVKQHNYNTERCILIDMSLPSGKNRLFVYNIKKDSLELASLVTHGYRSYEYNCNDKLQFSNMPYSFKTSLGKYKIGNSYHGHFGLAYKLHGLDSTNDRAFERAIVLHSHKNVPNTETYPGRIMESTGCPTVSPAILSKLDKYIKGSGKPVLMWIYN